MTHSLKTWPGEFEAVRRGDKRHEVRVNDRAFKVGDLLILEEWIPVGDDCTEGHLTGRSVLRTITYITPGGSWGLGEKICVLSIK
jgi:ASC-1-like (ASCH) protein